MLPHHSFVGFFVQVSYHSGGHIIYHPNQDAFDSEAGSAIDFKLRQQVLSRTVQANLDIWSPCLSLVLD